MSKRNLIKAFSQYLYLASTLLIQFAIVLMLPKLVDTESYALIVYAQAFAIWGGLLIEYGFSFSATRSITSKPESTKDIVNRIRNTNYILAVIFLIVSPFIAINLPLLTNHKDIIGVSILLAIVNGLTPWWYFQAKQQLYRLAFFDLFSSVLIIFSWFFLANLDDFVINILGSQLVFKFLIMVIGQWLVFLDVKLASSSIIDVLNELKAGFSLFFFVFSTAIYTTLNILVLGLYAAPKDVAIFSVAEKIMRLAVRFWEPLNRFFYPKSISFYIERKEVFIFFIRKIFWFYVGSSIVISASLFMIKEHFILYFLGNDFYQSISIFCILILAIPIIAISNVLGILYLLPKGKDKKFNGIIIVSGLFHVFISIILIKHYSALGMAMAVVITEGLVAVLMLLIVLYDARLVTIKS